jgi:hypothetical protein
VETLPRSFFGEKKGSERSEAFDGNGTSEEASEVEIPSLSGPPFRGGEEILFLGEKITRGPVGAAVVGLLAAGEDLAALGFCHGGGE